MKKIVTTDERPVSTLLLILCLVFVSSIIMSNILANNMLSVFIWSIDAGILLFPITYVLSDIFSEVYGYKWSRRVTWIAMTLNIIFSLLIMLTCHMPHPEWFDGNAFQTAVGGSLRIVFASAVSYQCGDWLNDIIFRYMKRKNSSDRLFPVRAIVSSFGGEIVDSSLFVVIAFAGTMPTIEIIPMILLNIFIKTCYEIVILPVTVKVSKVIKRMEDK